MDALSTMDEESALLILRLQLEDSLTFSDPKTEKGESKEGEMTDAELALNVYREDLERATTIASDRQMSRSITQACQSDALVIAHSQHQEQLAISDREHARQLEGGDDRALPALAAPLAITAAEEPEQPVDDDLLDKLSAIFVQKPQLLDGDAASTTDAGTENTVEQPQAESSAWALTRAIPQDAYRQCVSCQENYAYYDTAKAPCSHSYCRECLGSLFQASLTDDALFPPRCCRQPMFCDGVRVFLNAEMVHQYAAKQIEMDTVDRTYCSDPTCSTFIHANTIKADTAVCPACTKVTCALCKAPQHQGDCPQDVALQGVLALAESNGWQRCIQCGRLVELNFGCYHMTCVIRFALMDIH